jgi:phage shock protein A
MALINRIARLFKADFHAVLDRIEEPGQLLRQAIREMEGELQDAEQQVKRRTQEQQALAKRKSELSARFPEIETELDLCFASGKDELVRGLVRKKLETQRLLKRLQATEADTEEFLASQQREIEENRAVLESLKQKAEIFTQRTLSSGNPGVDESSWMARELAVSDSEIEVALLREQSARRAS